jgi:hypothetical protein
MRAIRLFAVPLLVCVAAAPARADIYCPKCGNRYPDSYNFCPKDGADLAAARKAAEQAPEPTPGRKQAGSEATLPPEARMPPLAAPTRTDPGPTRDWAADLPIHLPSVYPDANLGDFAIYEWTAPGSEASTLYLRVVLHKGTQGHVSVLAAALAGPSGSKGPPALQELLARIDPNNSRRLEWYDYRDFAKSFRLGDQSLRSPFVGADKAMRVFKRDFAIRGGNVGCEVAEYSVARGGKKDRHVIWMSEQVPFTFVQSTYQTAGETLRLVLFGTLDEDELAPLQRAFPGKSGEG